MRSTFALFVRLEKSIRQSQLMEENVSKNCFILASFTKILFVGNFLYFRANKKEQTSPAQFEVMVDFMTEHPDLSKGRLKTLEAKTTSNRLWNDLTRALNENGPPSREMKDWKKVCENNLKFH